MHKDSYAFLKRLMSTISPSGYEEDAARVWQEEARSFAATVRHDVHGNSHAVVNPGGTPRILFTGHYDEIGFLITHIDSKGYLWIGTIGGWDPQIPQGQRVIIRGKNGPVRGVIGKCPIHLIKAEDRNKVTRIERQWVDIGAKSRKEAEKLVAIGDPIVLDHELIELEDKIIACRGFDNKAGAFIILEAAKLLAKRHPRAEIHAVATVQEEIGVRGAITATFGVDPLIGIATDVCHATDYPGMEEHVKHHGEIKLGKGAAITRGPNIHPRLFELFVETAKKEKIPYQIHAEGGPTGTDARAIQVSRAGVITGLISIPNRYMHSSCELVHLDDLQACINLLAAVAGRITERTDFALMSKSTKGSQRK